MSYKLIKPYTDKQRADFIVKYNHSQGLNIEETETALYALEVWEKLEEDEVIDNTEEYEQEQAHIEAERIAMLNLTAADVERAIYKAKGVDFEDIITLVEAQPLTEETPTIDVKALKIELKANNFYRGNPYVETVGKLLGLSSGQMTSFFETNDYRCLTNVTLTIKAAPADAVVTINGIEGNTLTLPYSTAVNYLVAAEGYVGQIGSIEALIEDTTLDIELVEDVPHNAPIEEPEIPIDAEPVEEDAPNEDTSDTEP